MHLIKKIVFLICFSTPAISFASIDETKMSSNEYFSGLNDSEINSYCASGRGGALELDFCAKRNWEINDKLLNTTYKQVLLTLREYKPLLKSLRLAQRKWIVFRDAECSTQYELIGNGTMRNQQYFYCQAELTKEREKWLRDFYINNK